MARGRFSPVNNTRLCVPSSSLTSTDCMTRDEVTTSDRTVEEQTCHNVNVQGHGMLESLKWQNDVHSVRGVQGNQPHILPTGKHQRLLRSIIARSTTISRGLSRPRHTRRQRMEPSRLATSTRLVPASVQYSLWPTQSTATPAGISTVTRRNQRVRGILGSRATGAWTLFTGSTVSILTCAVSEVLAVDEAEAMVKAVLFSRMSSSEIILRLFRWAKMRSFSASPPAIWSKDEAMGTVTGIRVLAGEAEMGAGPIPEATPTPLRIQDAGLASWV
ncbi:hypothetical protein E2C01_020293 [Portunus trituberculatus]|uniref:Uncharacterized protein n=1 Tax=Portunus trituberculatus TaxID=210409 RepID=A0A5B7DZD8_PORTR|nr:hypothetical protein [Portunus trituberculatus]